MSNDIQENNKLIEKFYVEQGGKPNMEADLSFYSSDWNMLMPVVEKIEAIANSDDYEVDIFGNCCDIGGKIETVGETKIQAVYTAVIQFIKHYNEKI